MVKTNILNKTIYIRNIHIENKTILSSISD